ncbi:MAG: TatD family hydrolase [Anaerolineae bacterium]|nr:TatD family hydrolase [Anaerolineae bacterium]
MWFDAHCHLDDEQFASDLDAVLARAHAANVHAMITAGTDVASSRAVVALAERYPSVYAIVGIHPHYAETFSDETFATIRELATHPRVVGIGETGLDFHYADGAPREWQERVFRAHLDLAAQLGKPVVIHNRDAHDAVMRILRAYAGTPRGILHSFSGDLTMAQEASALGYYLSFSGTVTFKNAPRVRTIATSVPLDHIVLETDAPYLSPLRGRRNEPANIIHIATKIAELKQIELDTVAQVTTKNCQALFGFAIGEVL